MNNKYENIRKFLLYPDNINDHWESNDLIWIDWREDDESVINYFNSEIGNLIEVDFINDEIINTNVLVELIDKYWHNILTNKIPVCLIE